MNLFYVLYNQVISLSTNFRPPTNRQFRKAILRLFAICHMLLANFSLYSSLTLMILICTGFPSNAFAQEQQELGKLTGKITNQETGKPLVGCNVIIQGTYKGASTDVNGTYLIKEIKPGDYNIKVKYVGYSEKVFTGITIKPGATKTMDVKLEKSSVSMNEVQVVGDDPLVKLESAKSANKLKSEQIEEMNTVGVKDVVSMQQGVSKSPDGLQIRGGRVYETEYVVDGVSAQDPLSGTGFGLDVSSNSLKSLEVVTGGVDPEFGYGSSGLVRADIKSGADSLRVQGKWKRDNFGINKRKPGAWNTDVADINLEAPIPFTNRELTVFTNFHLELTDKYFGSRADQLRSSLLNDHESWAPRQDNKWSNTVKFAYTPHAGTRLSLLNQHSLNINQNTNSLRIIGNDVVFQPGFQYNFSLNMDNATTYTHQSNLTVLNWNQNIGDQWWMDLTLGRLFTNLRADANGRSFREETVDEIKDPGSIISDPVSVFNPGDSVAFVNPGPGLYNNGGISGLWHDHYAQEYSFKSKFNFVPSNDVHRFTFGLEWVEKEYQWIDVNKPWIGAPIRINDSTKTTSTSIGQSNDIWKAKPTTGGLFFQDKLRYQGITAYLGLRYNWWAPGKFVDNAVEDPDAPVLGEIRDSYREKTTKIFGKRFKSQLLPRLRVSFPFANNHVMYFNYSHAMKLPHPRFVYAGLDPEFQDNSFLSNLGNPDLDPEVTVSYELGTKSQLTKDLALSISAYYNDKYDYIVTRTISIRDQTGRFTERTFRINQDYARIRGVEANFRARVKDWLWTQVGGSYQVATGKSNSATESLLQIKQTGQVRPNQEKFLAWDRPYEFNGTLIFKPDSTFNIGTFSFENFRFFLYTTFRSGIRYTPYQKTGETDFGRPIYEPERGKEFSKVGDPWFWTDLKISRTFNLGKGTSISLSFEVKNLFNNKNAQDINPVTGSGYEKGDPLPFTTRNPEYEHPQNTGTPPFNPARWLEPRHYLYGISFNF